MIEKLIKRLHGSQSYESGVNTLKMATIKSNGPDSAFSFIQKDVLLPTQSPVALLVTLKNTKNQIPYENEWPMGFKIRYINQNDEEHQANVYIPVYAGSGMDFWVFMEEKDDFVKEVVGVERRDNKIVFDTSNFLNLEEMVEILKFPLKDAPPAGWTSRNGRLHDGFTSIEGGKLKLTLESTGNTATSDQLSASPIFDFIPDKSPYNFADVARKATREIPFTFEDIEKMDSFKIRFKMDSNYQFVYIIAWIGYNLYVKIFTTSSAAHSAFISLDPNISELVTSGVWIEKIILINEMPILEARQTTNAFNSIFFDVGVYNAPDADYYWYFDYMDVYDKRGNIGDTVDIIGLEGNIARLLGAQSILLSDVSYNLRVASMQRYVDTAFLGGLRYLLNDLNISISGQISNSAKRLFARMFSSFVVPSQPIIEESMNNVWKTFDPGGYVVAYGNFDDPYEMITEIYSSELEVDQDIINILVEFANRYRPVPAKATVVIGFETGLDDSLEVGDSGELTVTAHSTPMSSSTLMSPSTIMGVGSVSNIALPANYP